MGTSVSRAIQAHARTIFAALAAFTLTLGFVPASALADDAQVESVAGPLATGSQDDSVAASFVLAASEGSGEAATPNPAASIDSDGRAILASTLASSTTSIVSADVALDAADPIIGSFTVDGLTYAINDGGVTLVSVAGPLAGPEGEGSAEGGFTNISIPATVIYNNTTYDVVAIGPYAFYLSGATSVELPASILSVDDRAFRSSDVARVEVAAGNPNLASFDGCLYDSQLTSLLLIPEGRAGAVLLPETAEVVEPSKFSHCSLVDAISVGEGGAAFAPWEGLLYDASGQTLLRVPAGATEITIRDGCTTIAAGAMEGCAKLERINAPASVTTISPDLFESVPTIALPAASIAEDSGGAEGEAEVPPRRVVASSQGLEAPLALPDLGSTSASPSSEISGSIPQLTALVAVGVDEAVPAPDPHRVEVRVAPGPGAAAFAARGFKVIEEGGADSAGADAADDSADGLPAASMQSASSYAAFTLNAGGGTFTVLHYPNSSYPSYWNDPAKKQVASNVTTWSVPDNIDQAGYTNNFDYWADRNNAWRVVASRTGYTANGWSGYTMTWKANTYTVTLNNQSATTAGTASVTATYGSAMPAITKPARTGYTFAGYYTAANGGGTQYYTAAGASARAWSIASATTLYAKWTANTYKVTLNNQSATTAGTASVTATYGSAMPAITKPARTGYTFAGYYDTSAASGGTQYYTAAGASARTWNKTAAATLYARWTKNAVRTITLNKNSGTGGTSAAYQWTGKGWYSTSNPADTTTAITSITAPTRAGYTYKGYATSSTATTAAYWTSVSTMPSNTAFSANATLYAVWAKNAVRTITLNKNNGTGGTSAAYQWTGKGWYSTSNPADTTAAMTSITAPTRAGYTYKGYATSATATSGTYWTAVTTMPSNTAFSANATLYAVWAKNAVRTITLNKNNGTGGTSAAYQWTGKGWYSTSDPDDTTAPLDAIEPPVRAGYTYKGFATSPTAISAAYWSDVAVPPATNAFSANATLYAVWEGNEIGLSWVSRPGVIMGTSCTYSDGATVGLPSRPTWQGYAFQGWWTAPDGGSQVTADTPLPAEDATYYAHWSPAISADVPLEVTAKVDLLGVEEQAAAQAYLESRSAAGLEVAEVEAVPLEGAAGLFGAENLPSVYLEVIGGQAAAPSLRLALDQARIEADPDALASLALPDGYGTRVQVAYRFDIPEALLPDLQEATKQVVGVSYTVKLAEEPAP